MTHRPTDREAQALAEVGQTAVRRGLAWGMCATFLLLLAGLLVWELGHRRADDVRGAVYVYEAARSLAHRAGQLPSDVSEEGWWAGLTHTNAAIHAQLESIEAGLKREAPWRSSFLPPMNRGLSGILGAGNANVYPGGDGWLFYGPALQHVTGPSVEQTSPHSIAVLLAFQSALAERGVELVVLPVPGKVSLYPAAFSGRFGVDGVPRNRGYAAWLDAFRAAGGVAFDPTGVLAEARNEGPVYLRRDSHWTPRGVEVCAEALGKFLEERIEFSEGSQSFYRRSGSRAVSSRGDLATMLFPEPESGGNLETAEIRPVVDGEGRPWHAERGSEVLLLGDSFTNIYSLPSLGWGTGAGLAEQLSFHLQRRVDRIAQNDNGAYAARHRLQDEVAQGKGRLASTRVVVYEFAVRELSWGDWKPNQPMTGQGVRETSSGILSEQIVSGRVLARSLPPAPRSVPYKDCLISVLLEPEDSPGESLLFYTYGMVDHQWTAAATWEVGEKIRVRITPWSGAPDDVTRMNHLPLEGEASHDRAPGWCADVELVVEDSEPMAQASGGGVDGEGLEALVLRKESAGEMVVSGREEWLYFVPALRSLSVGEFWGAAAPAVSRARNAQWADPLPAILDFHRQLTASKITLILVPVPVKAAIYPDYLEGAVVSEEVAEQAGGGGAHARFLSVLRESGVNVVDLQSVFESLPAETTTYCKTDTHWSPTGAALAAREVAQIIRALPGFNDASAEKYERESQALTLHGDLAVLAGMTTSTETVPFVRVVHEEGGQRVPVAPNRESPILLIGDSHNLVFHAGGDMHGTGGGLPDLLALELGMAVDLVAVRGSGATTPRINLARRGDQLAGKNVVVWCFSAREFTESATGWRTIPVIP